MITDFLKDQAALYVTGAMNEESREQFEIVIEAHEELQGYILGLSEVASALTIASRVELGEHQSSCLKARITSLASAREQQSKPHGMVMTGPDGLVQWINPAFSALCGYSLEELRGKKLGPILQGADTDMEKVARIRGEIHALRPCRETLLNYHKNGSAYWVDLAIAPILDDDGRLLWMVAREREIKELAID